MSTEPVVASLAFTTADGEYEMGTDFDATEATDALQLIVAPDGVDDNEYRDFCYQRLFNETDFQSRLIAYLNREKHARTDLITLPEHVTAPHDDSDPLFRARLFLEAITAEDSIPLNPMNKVKNAALLSGY